MQSGPKRVWVRWSYLAVNMSDDSQPRLRSTEDYIAYCNGLVWRRMTYESLMPNEMIGYATDPVELFGVVPVGSTLLQQTVERRLVSQWQPDGQVQLLRGGKTAMASK